MSEGKNDKSKSNGALNNFKQQADQLADMVSQKTGRKITSRWLVGVVAAIVVVIFVIVLALPKHLSGTYEYSEKGIFDVKTTESWTFSGGKFSEKFVDEGPNPNYGMSGKKGLHKTSTETSHIAGTYKIDKDKLTIESNAGKVAVARLSKDKKSFVLTGNSDHLIDFPNGTVYSKKADK
ncbi:hypothetical protein [Furfurilactobacillus curtus]|uniref:Uncharacterized protein n=1 Tax=Furfurilactobacillus curtus TaxID=1746200 RepID=A0ABQ5JKW0_9LACO